jgi:hypothetical protein
MPAGKRHKDGIPSMEGAACAVLGWLEHTRERREDNTRTMGMGFL